jgi:hypothetical protein
MRTFGTRLLVLFALTLFVVMQVQSADTAPYLTVDGEVTAVVQLTASAFQKLPRPTVEVNDRSGQAHLYEGVALSQPLTRAGIPLRHDLKGAEIAKFLHAEGRDGFVAECSLPEFEHHDC